MVEGMDRGARLLDEGRLERKGTGDPGALVACGRDEAEAGAPARGRKTREVVGGRGFKGGGSEMDGGWLGAETKGESGGGVGIWWRLDMLGLGLDYYLYQMNLG